VRGRRPGLAELGLALASLVAFAGGAELVARAVDLRPASGSALRTPPWLGGRRLLREDYRERMEAAGVLARYWELYRWDRFLFYRLRPNVQIELVDVLAPPVVREHTRWSVQTHARGFRGAPFEDAPRPGVTRIALLGDSSTFGWGVDEHETTGARLRAALGERWGVEPARIEVMNLGVPGYSTFQGRVLLERVALPLAPHLVVWSYLSNDGQMTGENDAEAYARRLGPEGALLELLHASRAFETLEAWLAVARARLRDDDAEPASGEPRARNVADLGAARENVRAAVAAARHAGVPIVLLGQCTRAHVAAVMRDVALETGAPHLDATALLDRSIPEIARERRFRTERRRLRERYGPGELGRHPQWLAFLPDGCHPNPIGHLVVSEALAELVDRELPGLRP
jgi:lysophospholipase L1-like esterase